LQAPDVAQEKITCFACHNAICPTCKRTITGKNPCYEECPNCGKAYHKHCWDERIKFYRFCSSCFERPPSELLPKQDAPPPELLLKENINQVLLSSEKTGMSQETKDWIIGITITWAFFTMLIGLAFYGACNGSESPPETLSWNCFWKAVPYAFGYGFIVTFIIVIGLGLGTSPGLVLGFAIAWVISTAFFSFVFFNVVVMYIYPSKNHFSCFIEIFPWALFIGFITSIFALAYIEGNK